MSKQESVFDFIEDLRKQVSDCEHEVEKYKLNNASCGMIAEAEKNLSEARSRFSDSLILMLLWIYTLPSENSLTAMQKLIEIIDPKNS